MYLMSSHTLYNYYIIMYIIIIIFIIMFLVVKLNTYKIEVPGGVNYERTVRP